MLRQLDLFARGTPAFDADFRALHRIELDHGAWVDHVPGWVANHDALFDELERGLDWRRETMKMYDKSRPDNDRASRACERRALPGRDASPWDKIVEVPRLLARVPPIGAGQPLIEEMRKALSARYAEDFVYTTAALYRDGNDSVAFHGDTTARDMLEALVATVSLGEPRRFQLRPTEGGQAMALPAGRGDLIVMGGTCQRTWRHGISKVAHAGPRIALMFRPKWAKDYKSRPDNDRASRARERRALPGRDASPWDRTSISAPTGDPTGS